MSSESTSTSAVRVARVLLLLLGASILLYAISDHPFYGGERGYGRMQMLMSGAGLGLALCTLLPARFAGSVLLLAVTSLVMLVFAEIAAEILLASRHRPVYQADDRLIFKFIPSHCSAMTHAAANGGGTVTHCINSAGFRGRELLPIGRALRVVIYGDSFIHAYYSPEEETFAARLGSLLTDRRGGQIEIVNAGVSSYGPDQMALKMEDELPKLRPDLAVVAVFAGNDYGDLLRNKIFRLGADGTLVENRWRLDPSLRERFGLSQRESILLRAARAAMGALRGPQIGDARVADLNFLLEEAGREYRNYVVERDDVVTNTHVDYYSADVSLTPRSESATYKVALMRQVLRRIRDVAGRNGVPLVFLFVPHPLDVAEGHDWERVDRQRFPEYDGRNQVAPLEATARLLEVPYVSLYNVFRAHGASSLYMRGGDDHWNAAGQKLAAETMAGHLLAHGLLRTANAAAGSPARGPSER